MSIKSTFAAKLLCRAWSPAQLDRVISSAKLTPVTASENDSSQISVSCAQIALHSHMDPDSFLTLVLDDVKNAISKGSQLIVFPEYIGLVPLLTSPVMEDMSYQFSEYLVKKDRIQIGEALDFFEHHLVQPLFDSYTYFFSKVASLTSLYILAGSTIVKTRDGLVNRSVLFDPDGNIMLRQDKLHLSDFEKACGLISGQNISVGDTDLGRIAILIGTDQRIFEAGRAAHQQGAQLLLCPSAFSSSRSSEYFQSCVFMRCQECPVFGVSSWMTGEMLDWFFRSISGIYAPFAATNRNDGILIQTTRPSESACLTAHLNLEHLIDGPDSYTSDINPAVDDLLYQEHVLQHQTKADLNEEKLTEETSEINPAESSYAETPDSQEENS